MTSKKVTFGKVVGWMLIGSVAGFIVVLLIFIINDITYMFESLPLFVTHGHSGHLAIFFHLLMQLLLGLLAGL